MSDDPMDVAEFDSFRASEGGVVGLADYRTWKRRQEAARALEVLLEDPSEAWEAAWDWPPPANDNTSPTRTC